jgi:hypothetical protein
MLESLFAGLWVVWALVGTVLMVTVGMMGIRL